jgi:hypothetical protein
MSNKEQNKVLVRCRGCRKEYPKLKSDVVFWRGLCVTCERDRRRGRKAR